MLKEEGLWGVQTKQRGPSRQTGLIEAITLLHFTICNMADLNYDLNLSLRTSASWFTFPCSSPPLLTHTHTHPTPPTLENHCFNLLPQALHTFSFASLDVDARADSPPLLPLPPLPHYPTLPPSLSVSVVIGGRVRRLLGDGESVAAGLSVRASRARAPRDVRRERSLLSTACHCSPLTVLWIRSVP